MQRAGAGGFDLPAIEPVFDTYVGRLGVGDRLRFIPHLAGPDSMAVGIK